MDTLGSYFNPGGIMNGVNKVILIGNLGKSPELRKTQSGTSVVSFSIATSEKWKDSNGQPQTKTEWHSVIAWNKLADLANQYLKKGSSVYIEGKITTRSWEKDGQKNYRTEIVANTLQFLGGKSENTSQPSNPNQNHVDSNSYNNDDDLPF